MSIGTRNIALNKAERDLLGLWMANAWKMADDVRMGTVPGSKKEQEAMDYQIMVENIQAKLAGAVDEL